MTDVYVSVSVPKKAVAAGDVPVGLAFGLGKNRNKMAARLLASNAVRHKGQTVVCKVVGVVKNPKAKKSEQLQVHLAPCNRRSPTHVIRQDEQGGPVFQKLEDA